MTALLAPPPVFRGVDNNGNALVNGQLFTYQGGTTTPQATYIDSTQTTQNTNPVILNSRGECNLWLNPSLTYKLVLQDANGNLIWSVDRVVGGLTQAGIGQALYPQTAAELAAGVTPTNFYYPVGYVDRYGTNTTPGTTVMLTAVQTAFAVVLQQGRGSVTFLPGSQYFLGNVAVDGKTFPLVGVTGLSNCTIQGNGALIICNTTAFVLSCMFEFTNPNNVAMYDLNFTDTGFDQTQVGNPNYHGACAVFLTTTGSVDCSGFLMDNCFAMNMDMLASAWQNSLTSRLKGLQFINCRSQNEVYGLAFQSQGDDVLINNYVCVNPCRAYFPYGIKGHDVSIGVWNDGTNANATSNALCDIKRYDFDTKDIKLRLLVHGQAFKYGALVNLESQPSSNLPATYDGIDIDLRLGGATFSGGSVGIPVQIQELTFSQAGSSGVGTLLTSCTTKFKNISLRGDLGDWPFTSPPILVNSSPYPSGTGILSLGADSFNTVFPVPQSYNGFWIKTAANKYVLMKTGNLTTGLPFTIDVSRYFGTMFLLRVTVYAEADFAIGSVGQGYRQYILFGWVSGSPPTCTLNSTQVASTFDVAPASTITPAALSGIITSVGTLTGTGTAGIYTGIALTGGTGAGAVATIVCTGASGTVSVAQVIVTNPGSGYLVNDTLSFTITGGSGTCKVATVTQAVQVTFTAYTSANASARIEVEHLSKFV